MSSLRNRCRFLFTLGVCGLLLSPAGAWAGAEEIKLGSDQRGRVEAKLSADDPAKDGKHYRTYRVRLTKDKTYQIDLTSKSFDAYLYLKTASGGSIAEDDDGGGGLNSRVIYTPTETADFQIVATTLFPRMTGEFALAVGVRGAQAAAQELKLKDGKAEFQGQLADGDPREQNKMVKPFTCRFEQGKAYQINLASTDFDAYLYLFGPDGTKLVEDDDSGGNLNSRIVWNARVTGSYRILATSLGGNDTGNFTLTVSESKAVAAKPIALKLDAGKASNQGRLSVDAPRFRNHPAQVYNLALEGGKKYQIDLMSDDFDAYLYLTDKDDRILAQDDDGGDNLNSRLVHAVKDSGSYRIYACSLGAPGNGAYTLKVAEADKDAPVTREPDNKTPLKAAQIKLQAGMLSMDGAISPQDARYQNKPAKAYSVQLEGGKIYKIELLSTDFDAYLYLQDKDGVLLAQDDDSADELNSRIVHKVPQTAMFRIVATPLERDGKGKFTLNIAEASKEELDAVLLADKAAKIPQSPPAQQKELLREVVDGMKARADKLGVRDWQTAMTVARALEFGNPDLAQEAYRDFGKVLAGSSQERLAGFGRRMEGAARRLGLRGKEMELKGVTTDGTPFDLKKLRGKVVLVDFWATWCGPCVAEVPNMKAAYEKYHKRGFEIVGVSLDTQREALTSFIEKRDLPWKSIYDRESPEGKGLSDYYGVMAIPLPILVDREGRVVSMNARGPELERLLEELLADKK